MNKAEAPTAGEQAVGKRGPALSLPRPAYKPRVGQVGVGPCAFQRTTGPYRGEGLEGATVGGEDDGPEDAEGVLMPRLHHE